MTTPLLLDTNVIIDHLRGRANAVAFIRSLTAPVFTSTVVVAELYAGVRDGGERNQLDGFLSAVTGFAAVAFDCSSGGLVSQAVWQEP